MLGNQEYFYVDAGVTKFFWGDRMSVKLSGTDLFHGMKSGNRMYYNRASSLQINNYDSRKVMLTVRYKFNATRNKYKGSGAGESEKERFTRAATSNRHTRTSFQRR